jgi:hypothetical protein
MVVTVRFLALGIGGHNRDRDEGAANVSAGIWRTGVVLARHSETWRVSVGRRSAGRRGRPWDEESIRDELAAFLRGRTVWPTCAEFAIGGLKGLRDVLPRFGGPERWAREMGLEGGERPPGGVRRWTDLAIRSTLATFLEGRSEWPTYGEFRHAGLGGLYEKLVHEGLLERWTKEMGFAAPKGGPPSNRRGRRTTPKRPPSEPRQRLLWTDQRIADELALFLKLERTGRVTPNSSPRTAGGCTRPCSITVARNCGLSGWA